MPTEHARGPWDPGAQHGGPPSALLVRGNGISSLLDWASWLFVNPELTVYAHRPPRGEWIGLDARTELSPAGMGVAHSVLHDEDGSIGHAVQALLVDQR